MSDVLIGTVAAPQPNHFPRPEPEQRVATFAALWDEARGRRDRFWPAWRTVHDRLCSEGIGRTGDDLAEAWEYEWLSELFRRALVSRTNPSQAMADLRALAEACGVARSTRAWASPTAAEPTFWLHYPSPRGVFCRVARSDMRQAEAMPDLARHRAPLSYLLVFLAADRLLDPSPLTPAEASYVRAASYVLPDPDPGAHKRWRDGLEQRASTQIQDAIRRLALPFEVKIPLGMETLSLAALADAAMNFIIDAEEGRTEYPRLPADPNPAGNANARKAKGKKVNARMLEALQEQGDSVAGRSAQQWADALGCTKSSVIETPTWKSGLGIQRVAQGLKNKAKKPRRR